ncbi:uncharacterized protein LOC128989830 [Macrosteles quadrilineatus]|uniref:uncharacterized protein LOC128989830 n=1 Tax=Macrosteles quadrilineatus TaxID=74068 RepID=UPI0023E294D7|nr:uncharacterized protein LOC128989830 [Macrosteles quadrilineatus]
MISRSAVWGLLLCWCGLVQVGHPIQYTPGAGDCALLLGNDRSSLYDYGTNLLRGTLDYEGMPPCITYDAINQAYIEARKRIHVQVPPVERMWSTDEIAKVGELLLDITAQLTKTYGLSLEEIETGLPQIDTSKTLIQEVCPPYPSNM